ncbi:MAG: YhdP family phospholipid transporter [Acidithiobacillus sp.]
MSLRASRPWPRFGWLRRALLWLLAVMPTLAVVLAAAFYFLALPRLDALRPILARELAVQLGAPVAIRGLQLGWDWGPWLTVRDLRAGPAAAPVLEMHAFRLRLYALPLLWGDYIARDLQMDSARVLVQQGTDGRWRVAGKVLGQGAGVLPVNLDWARMDLQRITLAWQAQGQARPRDLHLQWRSSGGFRPWVHAQLHWSPTGYLHYVGVLHGIFATPLRSLGQGTLTVEHLPLNLLGSLSPQQGVWQGQVSGTAQLQWRDGVWREGSGRLDLQQVHGGSGSALRLPNLDGQWRWQGQGGRGLLTVAGLHWAGLPGAPLQGRIHLDWRKGWTVQLQSPALPLALVHAIPPDWLPAAGRWLLDSPVHGRLQALDLRWRSSLPSRPAIWTVATRLDGVGFAPHGLWPGMEGLSGSLDARPQALHLDLDSPRLDLHWPRLFADAVTLRGAAAQVTVSSQDGGWSVVADDLRLDAPGRLRGQLRWQSGPPEGGRIDLHLHLTDLPMDMISRLAPLEGINAGFRHWLQNSFSTGTLRQADLVLRGPLHDFPFRNPAAGVFALNADFRQVALRYASDWPAVAGLDAHLQWQGGHLQISSQHGSILGAPIAQAQAEVADVFTSHQVLQVGVQSQLPLATVLRFLRNSPILRAKALGAAPIQMDGQGRMQLHLQVPFASGKTTVTGRLDLQQAGFAWGSWRADAVNGPIVFSRDQILAQSLKGQFLGGPLQMTLQASDLEKNARLQFQTQGALLPAAAAQPLGLPALGAISGPLPYNGEGTLAGDDLQFRVQGDLQGLASRLPSPMHRAAGSAGSVAISGQGNLKSRLRVNVRTPAQAGSLVWQRQQNRWQLAAGSWQLDGNTAPPLPPAGILVTGQGGVLPVDAWLQILHGNAAGITAWPTLLLRSHWQSVQFLGRDWPDVTLQGKVAGDHLALQLGGRAVAGQLRYEASPARLSVQLQHLDIPPLAKGQGGDPGAADRHPGGAPLALTAHIARLQWDDHALQDFSLEGRRNATGWQFPHLSAQWAGSRWTLAGEWSGPGVGSSRFHGQMQADDIAPFLRTLGVDSLDYAHARSEGDLHWPGPPWDFALAHLYGNARLTFQDGRLGKLGAGLSWLVLVNPTSLLSDVLTFNYRPLFGNGLFFSRLSGDFVLDDGVATSRNVVLQSSAVEAKAEGSVDLQRHDLDLALQVYPLQSVDLLIGHFPLFGPALFGHSGKVVEWNYRVHGPWDHPVVRSVHAKEATP